MKSRCPHSSSARWTLLLLALTVSTATSFAQNVGGFIHGKIQNFQQTSPAAPVVNSAQPFQFGSLITMGTATINSATLTFSGTASPRTYSAVVGTGDFSILDTFTTQAQLDSAYQNGNFTVSIDTSAGIFSRTIFLFPFSYPTTPMLTVPASNWQSGTLVIDPTLDYTFTWNAFANAQAADVIELVIRNSGVTLTPFPATQTSFTLPAGSLQPGTTYTCDLAFVRVAGVTAGRSRYRSRLCDLGEGHRFHDQLNWTNADTFTRPHSHSYPNSDTYGDTHGNGYRNADSRTYGDTRYHAHCNAHCRTFSDAYTDARR